MARDLLAHLRELRLGGQTAQALALLQAQLTAEPDERLRLLAWQHEAFWWQPLQGPRAELRRRGPQDLALVRRCWAEADFMQRFNRMAAPLPAADAELAALLAREHVALPQDTRALHWTVSEGGRSHGFISVVDISLQHRRGELLIGLLPGAGPWLAAEAALLLIDFLSQRAGLARLTACFYPENLQALTLAEHFGFEREGLLRSHLQLADGSRSDLIIAGLVLDAAWFSRQARLRRRLLKAPISAVR